MYSYDCEEIFSKRGKTKTISKLCEIMKKNERCWSLLAQLEMKAARIAEKSNVVGQESEMEFTEYKRSVIVSNNTRYM